MERQFEHNNRWLAPQTALFTPWAISYERYHIQPKIRLPDRHTSLIEMFEASFVQFAAKDVYICQNQYLSYHKLNQMSLKVASYLQSIGLQQGDKVGIMLPNILQYPIIALGVLRAGMVLVNINPLYTSRELAYQLTDAQIKALFILENFLPVFQDSANHPHSSLPLDLSKMTTIVCRAGDTFGKVIGSVINGYYHWIKTPKSSHRPKYYHLFSTILAYAKSSDYQRPNVTMNDIALLQYTGGTTGIAKGAMLTHGNLIANFLQMDALMQSAYNQDEEYSRNNDIVLTALPLYHIFAFTLCGMFLIYKGYTGLLIPNPRDTKGLVKQLSQHRVSFLVGVNTLFNALLSHPKFRRLDFSGLKASIGGGMAISPMIAKKWHFVTGTPIIEGYGLSETSPVVTFNPLTIARFTNKIGIPAPSTDIKIINEQDKALPVGERGEIVVKGPQVMLGYYNRPYETFQAFTADGYLRTGDIGIMNERGFIKIVDRKKDMILVSGFNVYPHEIEEVINQHPDVAECAAIGIPSEIRGEEPKIFVVRKNNKVTAEQLLYFGKQNLTGYKRPRSVAFVNELPKSNVGKILRKELRKMEGLA